MLLTQLLRLRCQQPTCWRRESPGPRTPALAPVSSGPAEAPSRGYMTPSVPPLAPVSSSSSYFHLAPPAPPFLSTPGRSPFASLGRFSPPLLLLLCLFLPGLLPPLCASVLLGMCVCACVFIVPPLFAFGEAAG